MTKTYVGLRLKRLREERGLTQQSLADALGISLSYLNQIENNQRPITVPVLLRLNAAFEVDVQMFSDEEDARLVGALREVFADPQVGEKIGASEIREIASKMPSLGRAAVRMHRQLRQAGDRIEALSARLGDDRQAQALASEPYEEVRDYFYARSNHIAELDELAEQLAERLAAPVGRFDIALQELLESRHGLTVRTAEHRAAEGVQRAFDPQTGILDLSWRLTPGQRAFQLATQLCFIEHADLLERLSHAAGPHNPATRSLARIGLANYFAGALILPYGRFLTAAERTGYDIDLLRRQFGVGFETICHRLSTLQRDGNRGVPFFFVRVDRAGNISKRQSATNFHFSRIGGTCPLWNVYEAFSSPGQICTQVAEMPDGRAYLWVARTVSDSKGGYGDPVKTFAIGLGCDIAQADRLVYSRGLAVGDPKSRVPIGVGCKLCERANCSQRAFPPLTRELAINDSVASFAPYSTL